MFLFFVHTYTYNKTLVRSFTPNKCLKKTKSYALLFCCIEGICLPRVLCISAVLEELKDMPASEGFRLELVTSMKPTAIDAYNSNPKAKIDKGALELTKVRVMTDETYEKERSFERGPVNVNIHRGFTRTLTRSFDALTGVYEGGKQI